MKKTTFLLIIVMTFLSSVKGYAETKTTEGEIAIYTPKAGIEVVASSKQVNYECGGASIVNRYAVTNISTVPVRDFTIEDSLLGGDITNTVTLISGDENNNNSLDFDETWVYESPEYVFPYSELARDLISLITVKGQADNGDKVLGGDSLEIYSACIADPGYKAISIDVTAVKEDVTIDCLRIDSIVYTYTVTNMGNVPLKGITFKDDYFVDLNSLSYIGDSNKDSILDLDETWVLSYKYTITQEDVDMGVIITETFVESEKDETNYFAVDSDKESVLVNEPVNVCDSTLGVENFNIDAAISIYPNPVKDQLTISSQNAMSNVLVLDAQGRVLQSIDTAEELEVKIDFSNRLSGIYFVKIITENGVSVKKILKD